MALEASKLRPRVARVAPSWPRSRRLTARCGRRVTTGWPPGDRCVTATGVARPRVVPWHEQWDGRPSARLPHSAAHILRKHRKVPRAEGVRRAGADPARLPLHPIPIPSHPPPSTPIPYHPVPSHPVPSRPIPSHCRTERIPLHPTPTTPHPTPPRSAQERIPLGYLYILRRGIAVKMWRFLLPGKVCGAAGYRPGPATAETRGSRDRRNPFVAPATAATHLWLPPPPQATTARGLRRCGGRTSFSTRRC